MPQSFDDRSSARGQPPTKAPSSFARVASGSGQTVGGTANLRANAAVKTAGRKSPVTMGGESAPAGVQRFEDNLC